MTRYEVVRLLKEAGLHRRTHNLASNPVQYRYSYDGYEENLERFAELVAKQARYESLKRRGTWMFNPYTGTPRLPLDIATDPHGVLLLDPEQPIRAGGTT